MERPHNTAQLFAVQSAALFSLYVVLIASITLVLHAIDIWIFDPADGPWQYESATAAIRYSVATLVVFAPIYYLITYLQHRLRRADTESPYITFTRWLVYISFLIAGSVIAFQMVHIVLAFLEGELTVRVILKALAILFFVAVTGLYYYLDLQQYWDHHIGRFKIVAGSYLVAVIGVIALGILTIQSPGEARERSLDSRQIQDLQELAWRIDDHVRTEQTLPDSLDAVYDRQQSVPQAPDNRDTYQYVVIDTDEHMYELCATFAYPSEEGPHSIPQVRGPRGESVVDWSFSAGEWCFELQADQ